MTDHRDEVGERVHRAFAAIDPVTPLEALEVATSSLLLTRRLIERRGASDLHDLDDEIRELALVQAAAEYLAALQGRERAVVDAVLRSCSQVFNKAEERIAVRDSRRAAMD
jgi:hypothetical protein